MVRKNIFVYSLLLVAILLCSAPAVAQDKNIQKPTRPTQTTPAPKSSSSTTSGKSSNKSSSTSSPTQSSTSSSSTQSSTSNCSESQTTKQPSYIYPVEPEKAKPTTGYINGHEWADLGLSVKWATCNVGASSPSDYGNYYAWGDTSTKSSYTSDNSVTYGKNMGSIAGSSQYDAARANWGGTWRLPTEEEIDELIKCKHEWTTQGGHKGYKITGPNGNSIFLPAAGWRNGTSLYGAGEIGYYWSATPYEDYTDRAYGLYFSSSSFYGRWRYRGDGQSVRPVSE